MLTLREMLLAEPTLPRMLSPRGSPSPAGPARMLEKFERYPLTFGPTPIEKLSAPERASRRRGRALRQARGLQFGPRVRRQQAAQARIHRPRRDRLERRHAGLDRRRAVEPYPPGGGGRGQDRHEMPAGAGGLGPARGRGLRPGRQHHAEPDHGRGRPAGRRRLRHRHPQELGAGARRTSRPRAGGPMRFRPAPRCTNMAGSAMSASPRRCARRSASSASRSTMSSSAR